MIAKGSQRGGGQQLATHLMNEFDNDRVEIADVRGSIADDLHGAFWEWQATSEGTKCKKYLYSLSVNPDPRQGELTREQYYDFVNRAEQKLGLAGQPRAFVFHVKHGREHCHVVWSRIDVDNMKAVHISHDHQKLRMVAREFARDHGLELPDGLQKDRGLERFNDHAKGVDWGEKSQEERTGITKEERRKAITEAWEQSDTGNAFVQALAECQYFIARGDKRSYVVVDRYGEIHSLSRHVEGATARQIRQRLADFPLDRIKSAAEAQEFALQLSRAQEDRLRETFKEQAEHRHELLRKQQDKRRAPLDEKRRKMEERHVREAKALEEAQKDEIAGVERNRENRQPKGIIALLARVTGIAALTKRRRAKQDEERSERQERERKALQQRHEYEKLDLQRRYHALHLVDKREWRALETRLRLEVRQRVQDRQEGRPAPQRDSAISRAFDKVAERQKAREEARQKDRDKGRNGGGGRDRGGPGRGR